MIPLPDPPPLIDAARQARHRAALWRWRAHDTCTTSQAIYVRTVELLQEARKTLAAAYGYTMYRQTHKASALQRYEVVRIRRRPAHTWPNGDTTPEHEAYPSAHAWGRDGWTFHTLADAQSYFAMLARKEEPVCP